MNNEVVETELLPCRRRGAPIGNKNPLRHGHSRTPKGYSPTYSSWQSMLARCRYPARDTEDKYVNRGITVCDQWQSFERFLSDMGERPKGTTLERKDNEAGYSPDNCKWATPTQQARNRRNAKLDFRGAVEVAKARLQGEACKSIAARFNCSESLPREIVRGRTWKDALATAKEELCLT